MSITSRSLAANPMLRRARMGQWLTIGHGLFEGIGSMIAVSSATSVALLGFGLDSIIEVVSASIVLWRITATRRTLSEQATLRAIGVCFVLLSLDISQDSIRALIGHEMPESNRLGIVVATISVLSMPFLARAKRRWAAEIGSSAMRADARQTDFCAYLAGIALLGLALKAAFGWWWADPLAGLLMVPIIAWEGIQALRGRACGCAHC